MEKRELTHSEWEVGALKLKELDSINWRAKEKKFSLVSRLFF